MPPLPSAAPATAPTGIVTGANGPPSAPSSPPTSAPAIAPPTLGSCDQNERSGTSAARARCPNDGGGGGAAGGAALRYVSRSAAGGGTLEAGGGAGCSAGVAGKSCAPVDVTWSSSSPQVGGRVASLVNVCVDPSAFCTM